MVTTEICELKNLEIAAAEPVMHRLDELKVNITLSVDDVATN